MSRSARQQGGGCGVWSVECGDVESHTVGCGLMLGGWSRRHRCRPLVRSIFLTGSACPACAWLALSGLRQARPVRLVPGSLCSA
eukprot:17689-Chlamydomonas_euryale.AAC.1